MVPVHKSQNNKGQVERTKTINIQPLFPGIEEGIRQSGLADAGLADAEDVEAEPVLDRLVDQLVRHGVETHVAAQL